MAKRRQFTDRFKAKVAPAALRGDRTIQEIAAKHQVHPNQVSRWNRQAVEGMADVFARAGKPEDPVEAEVKKLPALVQQQETAPQANLRRQAAPCRHAFRRRRADRQTAPPGPLRLNAAKIPFNSP